MVGWGGVWWGAGTLFLLLATTHADLSPNGTYVSLVEIDVSMPEPLEGDVLVMEKWHYHFEAPHSYIFRTLPAGYNSQRSTHCDAIGQIFVFDGDDLRRPLPEVAPSLYHHREGSFEVLEDPDHLHVHVYFPPTQGPKTIVLSYRVRGGVQLAMMPLLHWGSTSVDKFIWNAVAGNNPMAVHNMTMRFSSQLSPHLPPSIYARAPIASKFITSKPSMVTLDWVDKEDSFFRLTGWKEGTPPLPPHTPYNYNVYFRARDQVSLLRISTWQREHLFQNLMDQGLGLVLLFLITAPCWYLLIYRQPWVVNQGASSAQEEKGSTRSNVGGAVELRLLLDGPSGLSSDLVHLDMLQALHSGLVSYSEKQDLLTLHTEMIGRKNPLPSSLHVLFKRSSSTPTTTLRLSEYSRRVRKSWGGIRRQAMLRLCQEGWYRTSVLRVRQQYTVLVMGQWLVMGAMMASSYLFRCARWWMTSQSLYVLMSVLALLTLPGKYLLHPLTVAGVQCAQAWRAYLLSLPDDSQPQSQQQLNKTTAYEYFGWRPIPSQAKTKAWADRQSTSVQAFMKKQGWLSHRN